MRIYYRVSKVQVQTNKVLEERDIAMFKNLVDAKNFVDDKEIIIQSDADLMKNTFYKIDVKTK